MIRVCCVIGTWQLVTLTAALLRDDEERRRANGRDAGPCRDILVAFETGGVPESFREALSRMAAAVWPWEAVVPAYDLLTDKRRYSQRRFSALLRELRRRVGAPPDAVTEVWVCWMTRPAEKVVFCAYPGARIKLYEDGLISYLPMRVAGKMDPAYRPRGAREAAALALRGLLERAQPVWRFRRSRWDLDPLHRARLDGFYPQLGGNAPAPPDAVAGAPCRPVGAGHLRAVLARAGAALPPEALADVQESGDGRPAALVLGQALSRNGVLTRNEERDLYTSVVEHVLAKGYRVLWKEHPRVSDPFAGELEEGARRRGHPEGSVRKLSLPHAYPVELVAGRLGLAACAAGTSAAPFYLRQLYGLPCHTFAADLLPRMKEEADVRMGEIVRRAFPPLADLPPAAAAVATAAAAAGRQEAPRKENGAR